MRVVAERALLKGLMALTSITAWERLPTLARPLGRTLWLSLPKRRAIAVDNLCKALGCREEEAVALAQRVFEHIALVTLEFLKMGVAPREVLSKVRVYGLAEVKEAWHRHGGLVLVTGHLGNFELMGARIAQELPLWVVARPQSPGAWQVIRCIREQVGMRVLDKMGSIREALRILRSGGVLGLLADQHAGDGDKALIVPFFGRPASVFKTPALLAARVGVPIVFCYGIRLPDGFHQVHFLPPRLVTNKEVEEATEWFCQQLERAILQVPEQWWWLHDRWKVARSMCAGGKGG